MIKISAVTPELKRIEFKDALGNLCVLVQSLNKSKPKIHFGIYLSEEGKSVPQMVLTPALILELLPFLVKFALEQKLFDTVENLKGLLKNEL